MVQGGGEGTGSQSRAATEYREQVYLVRDPERILLRTQSESTLSQPPWNSSKSVNHPKNESNFSRQLLFSLVDGHRTECCINI